MSYIFLESYIFWGEDNYDDDTMFFCASDIW